jgi:hypothetical protein
MHVVADQNAPTVQITSISKVCFTVPKVYNFVKLSTHLHANLKSVTVNNTPVLIITHTTYIL